MIHCARGASEDNLCLPDFDLGHGTSPSHVLAENGEAKTPTGEADLPSTLRTESCTLSMFRENVSQQGAHRSEGNTSELGRVKTELHLLLAKGSLVAYVGTKDGDVLEARTIGLHSFIKHLPNAKHPEASIVSLSPHKGRYSHSNS